MIIISSAQSRNNYIKPSEVNQNNSSSTDISPVNTEKTASHLAKSVYYNMLDSYSSNSFSSIISLKDIELSRGMFPHYNPTYMKERSDWDGYSKEKPESFSHVPDKLWEAMANSYEDGERMGMAALFDIPKWERTMTMPPILNKLEINDEKMLSYDYIGIIDTMIKMSSYTLPDTASEDRIIETVENFENELKQLHKIRENIASVLQEPLYTNNENRIAEIGILIDIRNDGGDQKLKDRYLSSIANYEAQLNGKVIKETVKEKGLFNEYFPQIRAELNEHSEEENSIRNEFKNYLLKQNSNLFDDLEVSPEINEEWYSKVLANHVSKVIEAMGPLGSPDSKWEVPILWEIQQQKKAQQG